MELENNIFLPGETIALNSQSKNTKISKQFSIDLGSNYISPKITGFLIHRLKEEANIYGLLSEPKKYFPEINDFIIGTIKSKINEAYIVDIGSFNDSVLGFYDFEGATKRNRPILNVGNLVYARVAETNKYLKTKISCISTTSKKEWVTGEAFFGDLKEGMLLNFNINFCKRLIQDKKSELLSLFKKYVSFEICIGLNGRIWIKSNDAKNTIILLNTLKLAENMEISEVDEHLKNIASYFNT